MTASWPALEPWQWALGALCAFLAGVAKTGVPGLGILVVPLMVLTVGDARRSAGWLLPLLCAADVFAVVYYRRHAHARRLFGLVPWVALGMAGGAAALRAPEALLRPVVGGIVLAMIALHVARRRAALRGGGGASPAVGSAAAPEPGGGAGQGTQREGHRHAAPYGVAAGFATMVANAAGPIMNLYLLRKRLPKEEFIATGAWFFLVINLSKLPVYRAHGMIDAGSLLADAALLPALFVGALSGRAIFRRLPQRAFEAVVLTLTAAAAVLLLMPR